MSGMRLKDAVPKHTSALTGQKWLDELLFGHAGRFKEQIGMSQHVFLRLSFELQMYNGLCSTRGVTAHEKLATLLHWARTGSRSRLLQERFQRSGETISKSIHTVLNCLTGSFYTKHVHLPPNSTPPEVKATRKFYPYFRECRGAIDGSHFSAWVPVASMPRYRNRKGFIGQNILAACNFALIFVYVLSGWEGSAADSHIYNYARKADFAVPLGKYYLADAGFPLCDALMTPYRGVRYHLKEWGSANLRPRNYKELFNLRHAQLRNVVERIFGVLKRRWAIFTSGAPEYPVETQAQLISAICALHNFIRVYDEEDDGSVEEDLPNTTGTPSTGTPAGPTPTRRDSSLHDLMLNEPTEISAEELGFTITQAERNRASARRDAMAKHMWADYKAYMLTKGIVVREVAPVGE
ncbi:putative nuclease HARBI1-like protein [Mycena chlorophos]|uniref:Putative nuclease HARBI1-like protein n=1 Tax=Mycena chlorophos TaxID=658473 RepID=A0A8H6VNN9_MYCCL|nr:putative nuclease HARBI1-like protein [Mycena chlorophos]